MSEIQIHKNELSDSTDFFNDFFRKLKICYPSWRSQLKTNEEHTMFKQQWLTAFAENNINTPEKLEFGLVQARKDGSSWLPACGQFIAWCSPTAESMGIPDVRSAYREAVFHQPHSGWSSPIVFYAQSAISYELKNFPESQSFKLFKQMYDAVFEQILAGVELAEPPKPLPRPENVRREIDPKRVSEIIKNINTEMEWNKQ